ncbi:MAG: hypothetical protein K0Q92_160 [Steroidobacteraceae bacterium]|jgi:hypothetical protein|nr:hypothetical protein [Steroidobacteraceae bacterium]
MRQQTLPNYPEAFTRPASVNDRQAPANERINERVNERSIQKMRNDTAASGEFRINLPPDVIAEMRRTAGSPRTAMQVDGFRPGLFGRLINLFTGRRR